MDASRTRWEVGRGTTISPHHVFLKPPSRSWYLLVCATTYHAAGREHFGPFLALTPGRKPLLQRLGFSILTTPSRKTRNTNATLPSVNKILRRMPQISCSTGSADRRACRSSSQLLLTPVHALIYVGMHGKQPRRPRQSEGKLQREAEIFIL
jgi:hypothetical protein